MAAPILTLANQITLVRMGLSPLLVVLVLGRQMKWALAVFVVAGLTDLLDGLAARRAGQRTTLGAMLDPVADKVLLTSYPSVLGKVTTVSQIVTVAAVLLLDAVGRPFPPVRYLFLATVALTVVSALHYVYLASTGRTGTAVP
ncbi:MAG: hypothetical protein DMF78_22590 [Acidobacteria bacterium]|nr:MAG: hypothetical protein DMF78_22590 [Acidobacteriota bacterium]